MKCTDGNIKNGGSYDTVSKEFEINLFLKELDDLIKKIEDKNKSYDQNLAQYNIVKNLNINSLIERGIWNQETNLPNHNFVDWFEEDLNYEMYNLTNKGREELIKILKK